MIRTIFVAALLAFVAVGHAQAQEKVLPKVSVGDVPPDAFGKDESGNPIRLADLRGKVVIVSFWASWCGYCRKELPVLEGIQKTVGKSRIEVIAVNSREDRHTYRALLRQLRKYEFTMTSDSDGVISDAYGVSGIPHLLMIGKDGIVGHVYRGYSEESLPDIVADLNALLAEPDPEPVAGR
jgi:thiol-disulfide isomerase/thioredoxin